MRLYLACILTGFLLFRIVDVIATKTKWKEVQSDRSDDQHIHTLYKSSEEWKYEETYKGVTFVQLKADSVTVKYYWDHISTQNLYK